tara:strand:+ start:360 stop:530 length:171 start_codon:yes stop_codon:yes gene_type:complete
MNRKRRTLLTEEQMKLVLSGNNVEKELIEHMAKENEDYNPLWPEDQYDKSSREDPE